MYNAIMSLVKSKKFFGVAILQLALGLSLLNYTNAVVGVSKDKANAVKSMFNIDTTYISRVNLSGNSDTKNVYHVIEKLDDLKKEGIVAEYITYFSYPLAGIPNLEEALFGDSYLQDRADNYYLSPITLIDETLFKRMDIKTVEGKSPTTEDFKKNYEKENIPIWIGRDFLGKVEVGDVFKTEDNQKNTEEGRIIKEISFEIVGVLDYNQVPSIQGQQGLIEKLFYNNKIILIPTVPDFVSYNTNYAATDYGLFVELTNNGYMEKYKKEFEDVCLKYNFGPSINGVKDNIESAVGNLDRELYQSLIIGSTLMFLSIIGISSILIGNINRRNKEFGIKLSQGASMKRIIREIIYEVIILVFLAVLLSFIILFFRKAEFTFSVDLIIKNIIFIIAITTIILTPVIFRLKKLNIVDLIRGK